MVKENECQISLRVDRELKEQFDQIAKVNGWSMNTALTMIMKRCVAIGSIDLGGVRRETVQSTENTDEIAKEEKRNRYNREYKKRKKLESVLEYYGFRQKSGLGNPSEGEMEEFLRMNFQLAFSNVFEGTEWEEMARKVRKEMESGDGKEG